MKKLKFEKKMLNKLLLLLFTTYVTTTFLNYPPMTKLQIHHIGSQSKINFFSEWNGSYVGQDWLKIKMIVQINQ